MVCNPQEEVVAELKLRRPRHGRSAEAQHWEILREVLPSRRSLKEILLSIPASGEDVDFECSLDRGQDVEP